jgi:hypothetical protein
LLRINGAFAMTKPIRTTQIVVRVTAPEREWFHQIAEAQGLALSDVVRNALAEQAARLGLAAPAPASMA